MLARWIRALLGLIAVIDVVTGGWAVFAPKRFYSSYPGFGHHWVAANPPYNEHLVLDTGAGFLAVGVVLLVAAFNGRRLAVLIGAVALLAHEVPHFLFHLVETSNRLTGLDRVLSTGGLGLEVAIGIFALLALPSRSVDHDPTSFFRGFGYRSHTVAAPPEPADE